MCPRESCRPLIHPSALVSRPPEGGRGLCVYTLPSSVSTGRETAVERGVHTLKEVQDLLTQALFWGVCLRAGPLPSMSVSRAAFGVLCSDMVASRLASGLLGFEKGLPQPDARFHPASRAVDSLPFKAIHSLRPGPPPEAPGGWISSAFKWKTVDQLYFVLAGA